MNDDLRIIILKDNIVSRNYHIELYCYHPYLSSKKISDKLHELFMKLKSK